MSVPTCGFTKPLVASRSHFLVMACCSSQAPLLLSPRAHVIAGTSFWVAAPIGAPPPQPEAARASPSQPCQLCQLEKFDKFAPEGTKNVGHQCGYCKSGTKAYYFCITCFPDGKPTHALCNPTTGRECFAQHIAKAPVKHFLRHHGPKRTRPDDAQDCGNPRTSPRRASPRAQRADERETQRAASAPARGGRARRTL